LIKGSDMIKTKKKKATRSAAGLSTLDGFLRDHGNLEDFQAMAIKEVLAWQITEAMKANNISRKGLAERMKTSRSQNQPLARSERRECNAVDVTAGSQNGGPILAAGICLSQFVDLRREPGPGRPTRWSSITSVAGAILVNAPTLEGWYLPQGPAIAISRTTRIHALLFSGLSGRKGERGEIGVTRIECSRTH
jgi:predicted XRE-type DNA-binding protein